MRTWGTSGARRSAAWFAAVFPTLVLNYMGQGALLLHTPKAIDNPFFLLFQAIQLGFLPRLTILHTSPEAGQVYVPAVNWGMFETLLFFVIVSVQTLDVPHVEGSERVTVDDLGYRDDGITHVTAHFGFQDDLDVPATLRAAAERLEREAGFDKVSSFLSRITIIPTAAPGMAMWRKKLFVAIARNSASPVPYFHLPDERTVVMSSHVEL